MGNIWNNYFQCNIFGNSKLLLQYSGRNWRGVQFDLLFGALGIIATGVFASLVWNQIRSQERSINIQNEQLQVSIKSISAQIVRVYHDSTIFQMPILYELQFIGMIK